MLWLRVLLFHFVHSLGDWWPLCTLLVEKRYPIVPRARGMYVLIMHRELVQFQSQFSEKAITFWLGLMVFTWVYLLLSLSSVSLCLVPTELRMQKARTSQVWMTRRPHTLLMWVLWIQSFPCPARFACTLKWHVSSCPLVCICYSLKGKPRLACLSSTWAMRSWEVGSWDWRTPWPTQGSSCFCESSIHVWYI